MGFDPSDHDRAMEAERLGAAHTVLAAGCMVVVASSVVHGITAAPGRVLYRKLTGG
jgi:hypothetical protein